jgi:hypothetical protein
MNKDENGLININRTIKNAAMTVSSASLFAAQIQSAKTEYERNEAIKKGNELLENMKKVFWGSEPIYTPRPADEKVKPF